MAAVHWDTVVHALAPLGGFVASLVLLLVTVAASWWLIWLTTISKLPFVKDMLGNREKKRRVRAEKEAEIQKLMAEHERSRAGSFSSTPSLVHKRPSFKAVR